MPLPYLTGTPGQTTSRSRDEVSAGIAGRINEFWRAGFSGKYDLGLGRMVLMQGFAGYEDECFIIEGRFLKRFAEDPTTQTLYPASTIVLFRVGFKTLGEYFFRRRRGRPRGGCAGRRACAICPQSPEEPQECVRSSAGAARSRSAPPRSPTILASPAMAQAGFPNRPIRLVVPWLPGGSADTQLRVLAELASKKLGQPVLVENKAGATGTLGRADDGAGAQRRRLPGRADADHRLPPARHVAPADLRSHGRFHLGSCT